MVPLVLLPLTYLRNPLIDNTWNPFALTSCLNPKKSPCPSHTKSTTKSMSSLCQTFINKHDAEEVNSPNSIDILKKKAGKRIEKPTTKRMMLLSSLANK